MNTDWVAMEHYRLHVVEEWEDGPRKESALAAIRSSLESLKRFVAPERTFECWVCGAREVEGLVVAV